MRQLLTAWRNLPALTQATVVIHFGGFVLLTVTSSAWTPQMSPRWMLVAAAVGAIGQSLYALWRGPRFRWPEATVLVAGTLFTVGVMTWRTGLDLAALANGATLPMVALYVVWFLPSRIGRTVLYAGGAWWFVAILQRDEPLLTGLALTVIGQVVIGVEVFSRIRTSAERLAETDLLTGAANRRRLTETCERHLARLVERDVPFSVIVIDLDGLRDVNNALGHRAGDQLLVEACRHWSTLLRPRDLLGRLGGDEFVIVLPGSTAIEAFAVKRRLRIGAPVAWSAGVAQARPDDSVASMLHRADERMYRQKFQRRTAAHRDASGR